MNENVQRTNRPRRIVEVACKANPTRQAEPGRCLSKLVERDLALLRLVHGSANDVRAYVHVWRQPSDRLEKDSVSLPPRERREQPHPYDMLTGRRELRSGIDIQPVSIW